MTNRLMMSVAAAALIAGAGFANAQGTMSKEGPSAGAPAEHSAPSNGPAAKPMAPSGMKATQSETKGPEGMKGQRAEDKDNMGQKPNNMRSETREPKGPDQAEEKAGMKTIVIVDDEFGLADVLASTLSDIGFRVLSAANGKQGLEIMVEHPPDLVLLDYMMPLLDGAGVLKAMRADPKLAAVPVIMMTAVPESVVRAQCHGYTAFLRKPFDFQTLLKAVERAMAGP